MTAHAGYFWNKVRVGNSDQCWEWLGYKNSGKRTMPYGRLDFQCVQGVYAHRVAYYLSFPGKIRLRRKRRGPMVLHNCDNPGCCNPAHLYLGTHMQNMRDKVNRKRSPDYRGVRGPRAKLTEEDVRWIRIQKNYATKKALALLYEVSEATISGCLYGRHYQDVH